MWLTNTSNKQGVIGNQVTRININLLKALNAMHSLYIEDNLKFSEAEINDVITYLF